MDPSDTPSSYMAQTKKCDTPKVLISPAAVTSSMN